MTNSTKLICLHSSDYSELRNQFVSEVAKMSLNPNFERICFSMPAERRMRISEKNIYPEDMFAYYIADGKPFYKGSSLHAVMITAVLDEVRGDSE